MSQDLIINSFTFCLLDAFIPDTIFVYFLILGTLQLSFLLQVFPIKSSGGFAFAQSCFCYFFFFFLKFFAQGFWQQSLRCLILRKIIKQYRNRNSLSLGASEEGARTKKFWVSVPLHAVHLTITNCSHALHMSWSSGEFRSGISSPIVRLFCVLEATCKLLISPSLFLLADRCNSFIFQFTLVSRPLLT